MIEEKKHSSFSASGSERWLNCPGSVSLCKGLPDISSKYAKEGTKAHELLEKELLYIKENGPKRKKFSGYPSDMVFYVNQTVNHVLEEWDSENDELLIEQKIDLSHIHPDMFGTLDIGIVGVFDTLQIIDFKYGQGHVVQIYEETPNIRMLNTQLVYYALGLAKKYDYNFSRVSLGISQPRAKHKGAIHRHELFSMKEILKYEYIFLKGVERCLKPNPKYYKGPWCNWCKGRDICPLYVEKTIERVFSDL